LSDQERKRTLLIEKKKIDVTQGMEPRVYTLHTPSHTIYEERKKYGGQGEKVEGRVLMKGECPWGGKWYVVERCARLVDWLAGWLAGCQEDKQRKLI
jgi:hypothetical protein